MTRSAKFWLTFTGALLVGLIIGWIDSRATWDDTGITVGAIFIGTAFFGAIVPERPWVWALLVGGAVSAVGMLTGQNFGALYSLLFAFGGVYTGWLLRKLVG